MFLLRHNRITRGPNHWTKGHHEWLRILRFDEPVDNWTFQELYRSVTQLESRVHDLDSLLAQLAEQEPYREPVARLRCFRGIDTLTAMTLLTELHGFERFRSPRALMGFLGLVPTEFSSGSKQKRGSITKTGHRFVRKAPVEAGQGCFIADNSRGPG